MIGANAGTMLGLCVVACLHWLYPGATESGWVDMDVVGVATVVGLMLEVRGSFRSSLKAEGVSLPIYQPSYSMLNRHIEAWLLDTLDEMGSRGARQFLQVIRTVLIDPTTGRRKVEGPALSEPDMHQPNATSTLIDLEKKFWQSMVDHDTDAAVDLLCEPALMVSSHGAMKFDHAAYRKMADQGAQVLKSFELTDMEVVFPSEMTAVLSYRVKQGVARRAEGSSTKLEVMQDSSTWVKTAAGWRCAIHTETPLSSKSP